MCVDMHQHCPASRSRTEHELRLLRRVGNGTLRRPGHACRYRMYPKDTFKTRNVASASGWSERHSMPPDWHKEWILALMVEGELSPDHSGSIVEIATRFRERFGALTLLLRAAQRPAPIRSIQMRSTNRGRLESLPGYTLGSTQLLSQFSHVATQTSHTLKWSLHGENVPDVDPLDTARRGIGNGDLFDLTGHSRAIRPNPRLSHRLSAGAVYSRFDQSRSHLGSVTRELTGAAPGCPEYKITADDVATLSTAPARQIES